MHQIARAGEVVVALLLWIGLGLPAHAAPFSTGCGAVPFKPIASPHAIDQNCAIDGVFDTQAHQAQNRAKNNFCASGDALTMSLDQFVELQSAVEQADVTFGARDLDRTQAASWNLSTRKCPSVWKGEVHEITSYNWCSAPGCAAVGALVLIR